MSSNTNRTDNPVVIVSAARTPMGAFQGELSALTGHALGTEAIKAAVAKVKLDENDIDEVIMGCVLPAGQGQAPARQAALNAGLPLKTGATTVNKMCGSGMKAVMYAHDQLIAGSADTVLAGGMESMSNAPYLLDKARGGMRMGHGRVIDHMFHDGLEDTYDTLPNGAGKSMGVFADETAVGAKVSRADQDNFALESLKRAQAAQSSGAFDGEITPVTYETRKGSVTIDSDELPKKARPEKIPDLRPAFTKDGTVTAATSSGISDGAAVLLMMRKSDAEQRGLKVLAEITAHSTSARKPSEFTLAPIDAITSVLDKAGWNKDEVDLFEINEAFAVVTLAAMQALDLDHEKVNVYGGACALGHPIGASGARILVTLLNAMTQKDVKKGVASLCIGGGEAVAVAIQRPE
tara:strand:- start:491 stop:1711 length:1221 start_codon:yes stop_codon:yes gene_type:complete